MPNTIQILNLELPISLGSKTCYIKDIDELSFINDISVNNMGCLLVDNVAITFKKVIIDNSNCLKIQSKNINISIVREVFQHLFLQYYN